MQTYGLPCDWKISMPDNWQGEYTEEDGQCVFYPDNSDLTIRIAPFHAERDGVLAPVKVMENAYINTIGNMMYPFMTLNNLGLRLVYKTIQIDGINRSESL